MLSIYFILVQSQHSPDECPTGYTKGNVNIPDVGSFLGYHISTKKECADLCFQYSECVSFEHNHDEMACHLNPRGQLQGPLKGYLFCYNIGNIELFELVTITYYFLWDAELFLIITFSF